MKAADRREFARIAASLTMVCAVGAVVLGATFLLTERYREAAEAAAERAALAAMLDLAPGDRVLGITQAYDEAARQVVYRAAWRDGGSDGGSDGGGDVRLVFGLDGTLVAREAAAGGAAAAAGAATAAAEAAADEGRLRPLGRTFVGWRDGRPAAFALEGVARGYKNRIRFLVALDDSFTVTGVRVVEHEEDPGLGAEVATGLFTGQYVGRPPAAIAGLDVTRDPMPEDWRRALVALARTPRAAWLGAHAALVTREHARPVYAVTGATISSRALTDGVRSTVGHFRQRWALLEPHLTADGGLP